jgi:16S rRNA (uracil1498-N3)-methyltransferase
MMIRFFAAPSDISGGVIRLSAETARHIRSLRLRPLELFTVCDGDGTDYTCRLGERDGGTTAEIVESSPSLGEPSVECNVYVALAKGERLEFAVQKSVEIGARKIVLFPSSRVIAAPSDIPKKTARLQRIAMEAAMQSIRGRVPDVIYIGSIGEAVAQAAQADLPLFFYECEEELHIKQVLESRGAFRSVSIMTGPEGGFAINEAELAQSAGMTPVTLGPRILRCETAPIAALAAIMYHTGNMRNIPMGR